MTLTAGNDGKFIETYKGYDIYYLEGEGYSTRRGMLGYEDTLEAIKDVIDEELQIDSEGLHLIHEDTPSLPDPWWKFP